VLTKKKIEVIEFLKQRRSIVAKKMLVGRVLKKDLNTILEIGTRVPDHGALKPWSIKVIQGINRKYLDKEVILKEFKKENKEASIKAISIESNRFQRAHTILAVFSTPVIHKNIPEWEQNLSAGAVCTNLLYAAQGLGYAAQWLTEWYAYNKKLIKALGGNPNKDKIAGFIYIGKKITKPKERTRPNINEIVNYV
jgi:nitroreductase